MPIEYLMWSPLAIVALVLYVTLCAAALVSLASSDWASVTGRRVWAAVVLLLPVAGAVLWLAASHRHQPVHPDHIRTHDSHPEDAEVDAADPV